MNNIAGLIILLVIIEVVPIIWNIVAKRIKGASGEYRVANLLDQIDGFNRIINNVMFNDQGKSRQVDHIAITEYGVFVIETKNYAGTIYGTEKATEWKQKLYKQTFYFQNPINQNYGHVETIRKIIDNENVYIEPIVLFTLRSKLKVNTKTKVMYDHQIKEYIEKKPKVLKAQDVSKIYNLLLYSKITNKEEILTHNSNVRKYVKHQEKVADAGKCPRCNGDLVLRHSKKGDFYGCSNYPKCRYTKNIKKAY